MSKVKRVFYSFKSLSEQLPELNKYANLPISEGLRNGVLEIVDSWAEENNLELFNLLTPLNDSVTFIFNKKLKNLSSKEK